MSKYAEAAQKRIDQFFPDPADGRTIGAIWWMPRKPGREAGTARHMRRRCLIFP